MLNLACPSLGARYLMHSLRYDCRIGLRTFRQTWIVVLGSGLVHRYDAVYRIVKLMPLKIGDQA